MELRSLRYFLTVAREGNITQAAKVLYVTQPALSRQLKSLEEELHAKLFVRGSHSIVLTDRGVLLKQRCEEILELTDKTVAEFALPNDVVAGDVHIGVGESYTSRFLARVARELQERYPGIHYRLYDGNADDLTERLDRGLLDFCVLIQPADLSKYHHLRIPDKDVWGLLMRRDNPLAAKSVISAADLLDEPLILSEQTTMRTPFQNAFSDWFGESFEKLDVVATYNLTFNATLFAAEGFGSVVCLERQTRVDEADVLCFKPFDPRLEVESDIVWKKHRPFSPAAAVFLHALKEDFSCTG